MVAYGFAGRCEPSFYERCPVEVGMRKARGLVGHVAQTVGRQGIFLKIVAKKFFLLLR